MKHTPLRLALAAIAAVGITSTSAFAATYTWDGGGADNNLNTANNWNPNGAPVASVTNDLIFAGSTRRTPFNGGYVGGTGFRDLTFASGAGAFNITGDRFVINGDIINNSTNLQTVGFLRANADQLGIIWSTGNHTINAASGDILITGNMQDLAASTTLNKTGNHTLTLSNLNPTNTTYTWDTNVQQGTVSIANVSQLGYNSFSTNRVAGQGFTVSSGASLAVGNAVTDGQLATMLGTTNFAAGSNVGFDTGVGTAAGDRVYTANITDTAQGQLGLLKMGANTLTVSGTNTFTGNTTIRGGVLAVASKSSLPGWNTAGRYSVGANAALAVANEFSDADIDTMLATGNYDAAGGIGFYTEAGNRTYSENITGARGLAKAGANTLIVDGTNTYTGSTWISGGTLKLGSALGSSGSLKMTGTGTLDLNGNNATTFTTSAALGGNTAAAGNTITDNAAGTGTSVITLNNNNNQLDAISALITDGATRKVGVTLVNNAYWYPAVLNSGNTYSGGTLVTGTSGFGSRLAFGVDFASNNYTPITSNGTLISSQIGVGALTLGQNATDKGQLMFQGTTDVNFYNDIVFNTTLGADMLGGVRFVRNGMILSGTQTANLADASYVGNGGAGATITGQITGSNGFRMVEVGHNIVITLNNTGVNPNDYAGNTSILRATSTLQLGADNQLPDGSGKGNVNAIGTLRLNGFSDTINGLTGNGTVHNNHASNASTLTVGAGNATASYTGTLANGGAAVLNVAKTGSGTQTFAGNNTYTGTTSIDEGTLLINGNSGSATGAVSVGPLGTLGGNGTLGGAVTVAGNLKPGNSPGDLTFNDDLTLESTATLTLEITGILAGEFDRLLGDGANTFTFGGTLALDNTGYSPMLGDTITVFDNWGAFAGSFSGFTGTNLGGGLSWDTSTIEYDGTLTVVPEPTSMAMLIGGMGVLVLLRRRA